jgi:aspartyl-tRNA(Asn)/glutamyl-tRNA(Gln) amidotransferase subunit A
MTAASTAQTNLIHYLDATTLAALIRTKQLSSREVVQAHLDRVAAVNPKINAVVTLMADDALKSADAADKMVARGAVLDPCTASRSPSRIHWIRQAS